MPLMPVTQEHFLTREGTCEPSSSTKSTDIPEISQNRHRKSLKRRAAELNLAKRLEKKAKRDERRDCKTHQKKHKRNRCPDQGNACTAELSWTSMPVALPHNRDWVTVMKHPLQPSSGNMYTDDLKTLKVIVVERESQIDWALDKLFQSMRDDVIAIDLEWRPDSKHTDNPVALIQLASESCCVLFRCHGWDSLPKALISFFASKIVFIGFAWDSCDEKKMQSTFGFGKNIFRNFIDLQKVAARLGYPETCGLSSLCTTVLGQPLPKTHRVSRSDWQRETLSRMQITYAALDALITGIVFRRFRAWHAAPSPCASCGHEMGVEVKGHHNVSTKDELVCMQCDKIFKSRCSLVCHVNSTGHQDTTCYQCTSCGRLHSTV